MYNQDITKDLYSNPVGKNSTSAVTNKFNKKKKSVNKLDLTKKEEKDSMRSMAYASDRAKGGSLADIGPFAGNSSMHNKHLNATHKYFMKSNRNGQGKSMMRSSIITRDDQQGSMV